MLLKGLVFQTMPQPTMIAAIAAVLRGAHRDRTPPLSEVRNYLKTEVAFEKGNLKIGKLIMEEIARQNACQSGRVQARHIDPSLTIELTVRESNLNRDGERTDKPKRDGRDAHLYGKRINALSVSMFGGLDCAVVEINGAKKSVSISDNTLAPVYRTVLGELYYSRYLFHSVPGTKDFQAIQVERYGAVTDPAPAISSAAGSLVTLGHAVTFDRHTVTFTVDGVTRTPVEVVQQARGGKVVLIQDPRKKA